jgi:hypothetical protein
VRNHPQHAVSYFFLKTVHHTEHDDQRQPKSSSNGSCIAENEVQTKRHCGIA